jgi:hypothetical protein
MSITAGGLTAPHSAALRRAPNQPSRSDLSNGGEIGQELEPGVLAFFRMKLDTAN